MPYKDLYLAHALHGSLFQTICIRKAALLVALDNDVRDQSEIEAELPNNGDYAHWMSPELEPSGKLKTSRDRFERALLKSLGTGRLSAAVVARNLDDEIDPIYTLVPTEAIREWCQERDVDTGDWLMQHEESDIEFTSETAHEIANYYMPSLARTDDFDFDALEAYKSSEESRREELFRSLLQEVQRLRAEVPHARRTEAESPINTKEKNSLLTVIAALVNALDGRLPNGYKRAEAVARFTDQIGASVSVNTVDKILKQTDSAVERRRDAYK
ncbi:hypothetical protein [Paraburkholderia tropica]|uniref:Uncharacterized protein n=1 Tax=Paraburkholderia tropica TaxID=92647 RepID=A0AAQ1GJ68_9BURK|nr:hypothetical protein [Paraburkholderia tropica]RQN35032.1 hypothetical protein EHZ25_31890 [Paraburkholderia tropica]SEK02739.1 hypothetical protein SAMN05216550_113208 [Paraburkholderia tropica]